MRANRGRPRTTSREEVGHVALELFAQRGFEATTLDDIAEAVGIGRRTLFRYFPSKNDMVWGEFDAVIGRLRDALARTPADRPLTEAITAAVIESNRYDPADLPELRIRMSLITTVPALQAHAMIRYAAWRRAVAEFAAERLRGSPDDLTPVTLGFVALGASMAAFVRWVAHPDDDLETNLSASLALLADHDPPNVGVATDP